MAAVVLIGSTGNGKSTLGNYLIDPSREHRVKKQTFPTAKDNKPLTQNVTVHEVKLPTPKPRKSSSSGGSSITLTIIDTPGLNESEDKDLEHMIAVMQNLKKVRDIQACLFVVKFSNKLDAQYKATVEYYSTLLPTLFERNTAIVMTDFPRDERSEELREDQDIDVEKVKQNTIKAIRECGGLTYTPTLFLIDCMPVGASETKVNEEVREALLQYICNQPPVTVDSVSIAKPPHIRHQDAQETKRLEGQINGYNKRLMEVTEDAGAVLKEIEIKEARVTDKRKQLQSKQKMLDLKNTEDKVTVINWAVNEDWKACKTLDRKFELKSSWRLTEVEKQTNAYAEWTDYLETEYEVTGKVTGKFSRGLYASLKLRTTRKIRFADEITLLDQQIQTLRSEQEVFTQERNQCQLKNTKYENEIKQLLRYIEEKRKLILKLSEETMTIEEAIDLRKKKGQVETLQ